MQLQIFKYKGEENQLFKPNFNPIEFGGIRNSAGDSIYYRCVGI